MIDKIEKKIYSIQQLAPLIGEIVDNGGKVRFTVTGNSMFPHFVSRRDTVLAEKALDIKKHDIVLHRRSSGEYILHRVVSVRGDMLDIAGDNEIVIEKGVCKSQVIAKVCEFTRKGKTTSVNSFPYKLYSALWVAVLPIRYVILNITIPIRGLFHAKK